MKKISLKKQRHLSPPEDYRPQEVPEQASKGTLVEPDAAAEAIGVVSVLEPQAENAYASPMAPQEGAVTPSYLDEPDQAPEMAPIQPNLQTQVRQPRKRER
ncbi:MAG: hypothetical protein ACOYJA_10880 [Christensenellales bacterium]|jgi:hypothetical protein